MDKLFYENLELCLRTLTTADIEYAKKNEKEEALVSKRGDNFVIGYDRYTQ